MEEIYEAIHIQKKETATMDTELRSSPVQGPYTVTFERDDYGSLRCKDYIKDEYLHVAKNVKGKVVIDSEKQAWEAARKATRKEKEAGTHNPAFPIGPYWCKGAWEKHGIRHYHIGRHASNVGRKPSITIRLQLMLDRIAESKRNRKKG